MSFHYDNYEVSFGIGVLYFVSFLWAVGVISGVVIALWRLTVKTFILGYVGVVAMYLATIALMGLGSGKPTDWNGEAWFGFFVILGFVFPVSGTIYVVGVTLGLLMKRLSKKIIAMRG